MTETKSSNFPYEVRGVEPELTAELSKYFKNEQTHYIRVGPKGYFLPGTLSDHIRSIYNLQLRSSDIFVTNFPRSGSTWTRELVWIVANDFVKPESQALLERYMFLEGRGVLHPLKVKNIEETRSPGDLKPSDIFSKVYRSVNDMASPRFMCSHLPLSLLPPALLDTCKMVYVARDPRDVVVSFYHLSRLHKILEYEGDFKTYWKLFISNSVYWTPIFEHIKESWEMRHHSNMLFLFYEDLSKNLPAVIRQVARFLDKSYTEEQIADLAEYLNFNNFMKNKLVNLEEYHQAGVFKSGEQPFIRKGKTGGWRDYFDEEMIQQSEKWMADNLRNSDLGFPDIHHV